MPLPETFTRTTTLVRHNLLLVRREPGPILSRMILPLVFLTLLRPLYTAAQGPGAGTEQAVVGTVVTFSLLALSISGSAILTERLARTWDRLRAGSAHPVELFAGKAVPAFTALLAQQALIVGFAIAVLGLRPQHYGLLAAVLLSWSVTLLGLGTLLGVLARSMGELSAAYDIGGMLFSSLGGALVPLAVLPHWVAVVAPISPGYWAARGLHAALAGDATATLTTCATLLTLGTTCAIAAALRLRGRSSRLVAL
ncbi:ABC transporter permease [Nocardia sp. BMG111209]|uniref:ABC transporter permease n=1 Tax=Nocardia sp. BMG111209 TaxID=1160137 RepID=UPI000377184F|nr:ABC transporter permease [Nocardia sp. BMG111209]